VQLSVNLVVVVSAEVAIEPLGDSDPLQPPEAVQDVAFVDDQFKIEPPPLATVVGFAVKATVGAGGLTETVADCVALPPPPVHVRLYVALAVSAPVAYVPLIGSVPDQAPEAVQDVAFVDAQDKIELPPPATVLGPATRFTVGAGAETVTVAD